VTNSGNSATKSASDFDDLSLSEWRDDLGSEALGLEGEPHFVFQVVIPAQSLLFRSVSVHDGFVVDSVFPDRVSLGFRHCLGGLNLYD